ncbi:hypothetical protein [Paratractidigestivibacter sp.]|uniref:AEC family transporter n=1 Tax=Paratractidigestivibacter sp. TaxID=2847316 RepID=UPI002ABD5BC2|nr:hypothetical protein [Paratractidigestivibacter sp.]
MAALQIVLPVFFVIALGALARRRGLVSAEQCAGMMTVVNGMLFPIMVFNAIFTSSFDVSALAIVAFILAAHLTAMGIGRALARFTGPEHAAYSPYLMASVEGGNVCLPLYSAIVGAQYMGNVVLLDLACMLVVFLIVPALVTRSTSGTTDIKTLALNLLRDPIVIAIVAGLLLNIAGLPGALEHIGAYTLYSNVVSTATAPIVTCILFNIGFNFSVERSSMGALARCIGLRVVFMAMVIVLFFVLFPQQVADPVFRTLVPLYFMCPPALVLSSVLEPLTRGEKGAGFVSAFISLYMVVTLVVFSVLAVIA